MAILRGKPKGKDLGIGGRMGPLPKTKPEPKKK